MKKYLAIVVFIPLFFACGDSGSSSSDATFKIQPGDLDKFGSPSIASNGLTINTDTGVNHPVNYAIIYSGTVNNTNYVGIAFSDNPDPMNETYNLKIYFTADSIPTGLVNDIATIIEDDVAAPTSPEALNLTINGPTANNGFDTYLISGNSASFINSFSAPIRAVHVGPNAPK